MKRTSILLALILCLAFNFSVKAQFKQIAESDAFGEPGASVKLIQLENGGSFYLYAVKEGIIFVQIFDAAHKQTASKEVAPTFGKLKAAVLYAAFEVENDIVVFISEVDAKSPVLHRIIIDGSTGNLKNEEVIASIEKGNYPGIDNFSVKQDPVSESYAVLVYYVFEGDKDKRVQIVQYDNNNKEVNKNFLSTNNDDDYKFFIYMDMQVINRDKVAVFLYNGKEKYFNNTKKGRVVVAIIDKNAPAINYVNTGVPEELPFKSWDIKYSAKANKLYMIVMNFDKRDKENYDEYLVKINMQTSKAESSKIVDTDPKINTAYKDQFSIKKDYLGVFREFSINEDESYTVVYEEDYVDADVNTRSSTHYIGKIMALNYSSEGKIISGYIVPKLAADFFSSNYRSYLYVDNGSSKYISINDTERNNEVKKDKFVIMQGYSEADAFLYKLSGDAIFPKRDYVFGKQEDGHNLILFAASDYNKATNTLMTLRLSKKSQRDKNATMSIVWLQPQ